MIIECDGPEDVAARIKEFAERFPESTAQALWEESQITMNRSMRQCPVDSGRLRATGQNMVWNGGDTRDPEELVAMRIEAGGIEAELGYYTDYAIYVHEDLTKQHGVGLLKANKLSLRTGLPTKRNLRIKEWGGYEDAQQRMAQSGTGITKAKFLEDPVNERAPMFLQLLTRRIKAYAGMWGR